jgi:hypothetical protein
LDGVRKIYRSVKNLRPLQLKDVEPGIQRCRQLLDNVDSTSVGFLKSEAMRLVPPVIVATLWPETKQPIALNAGTRDTIISAEHAAGFMKTLEVDVVIIPMLPKVTFQGDFPPQLP